MHRAVWNLLYLFRRTPWDTSVTPPELRAVVESGRVGPGRALDLGCGTGTNVVYLAQYGFEVIGVDISSRAVALAQRRIEQAGLTRRARVYAGDVTRLDTMQVDGHLDLALDIGCLHSIDGAARQRYAAGLVERMRPGGLYLLYAFGPRDNRGRPMGLSPQDAEKLFSPAFELLQVNHGQDRDGRASAWYTFQRRVYCPELTADA